jgi:dTDP-4-amino-4,6-dideoxygalactose transaminase
LLRLPLFSDMNTHDINRVIEVLTKFGS